MDSGEENLVLLLMQSLEKSCKVVLQLREELAHKGNCRKETVAELLQQVVQVLLTIRQKVKESEDEVRKYQVQLEGLIQENRSLADELNAIRTSLGTKSTQI